MCRPTETRCALYAVGHMPRKSANGLIRSTGIIFEGVWMLYAQLSSCLKQLVFRVSCRFHRYLHQVGAWSHVQATVFTDFFFLRHGPTWTISSSFIRFLDHTQRHTTVGRVTETSIWQHTTLTSEEHPCPAAGFEPANSAGERPQTYVLDRPATGTDLYWNNQSNCASSFVITN